MTNQLTDHPSVENRCTRGSRHVKFQEAGLARGWINGIAHERTTQISEATERKYESVPRPVQIVTSPCKYRGGQHNTCSAMDWSGPVRRLSEHI